MNTNCLTESEQNAIIEIIKKVINISRTTNTVDNCIIGMMMPFVNGVSELHKPTIDLIDMAISNFDNIAKRCEKVTSGNFTHDVAGIKGVAIRNSEYLKECKK